MMYYPKKTATMKAPNSKKAHPKGHPTARRFSRLYRCLAQRDTKVVLSLGGGGIRLAAHTAVIRFLEDLGAVDLVSEVWGASGGSIIAALFSLGCSSTDIQQMLKAMYEGQKRVQISPSFFTVAKNIVRQTVFSSDSKENIRGFHHIHDAIQELIGEYLKSRSERYPFYCLAYNLGTNQTDVLTPRPVDRKLYGDWIYQTDPLDAVVASSSVPIIFVPKVIDDDNGRRVYADGATNEEVPSVSLYRKWLRDRELGLETRKRLLVIAVNLNPEFRSLGFMDNWLLKSLPVFQYVRMTVNYADLMRKARIEEQKRMLISDPNVEYWQIDITMQGGGLLNVGLIPKIIAFAEKSVPEQFERINDSLLV